jgi:hypothetical protein
MAVEHIGEDVIHMEDVDGIAVFGPTALIADGQREALTGEPAPEETAENVKQFVLAHTQDVGTVAVRHTAA